MHARLLQRGDEDVAIADAVVIGVADHRDALHLQNARRRLRDLLRHETVGLDNPEGPFVLVARDVRIRRPDDDIGNTGPLGHFHIGENLRTSPTADDKIDPLTDEALHGRDRLRRVARVVRDDKLKLLTADAARVVYFLDRHFSALLNADSIRGSRSRHASDDADLDVCESRPGARQQAEGGDGCEKRLHVPSPSRRAMRRARFSVDFFRGTHADVSIGDIRFYGRRNTFGRGSVSAAAG